MSEDFDSDVVQIQTFRSVDDAMAEFWQERNLAKLGGPSGRGWSLYSCLQRCPYAYARLYGGMVSAEEQMMAGAKRRTASALEVGTVFHLLVAIYYQLLRDPSSPYAQIDRTDLCQWLVNAGCSGADVSEAERLADAYILHYDADDYLEPLAVEEIAVAPKGRSCRFDVVARVGAGAPVLPGIWLVEHKTTSRMDIAATEGWLNDGEIIGQQLIWRECDLDAVYGPLLGTIVNLVTKTKVPALHRLFVPLQEAQLAQHASDLDYWEAQRQLYHAHGRFPRARQGCIVHNRLCELFYECAGA